MKYLLDVSTIIAMAHQAHPAYARAHAWIASEPDMSLASCVLTDLGLIRISMMLYSFTLPMAESLLKGIKKSVACGYVGETPPPALASWVLSHKQTTDAYLCQLAAANGMKLATLDAGIKDSAAYLIP